LEEETGYKACRSETQLNGVNAISARNERIARRAMFNANFLFASLIWGSVGGGYFIYGKKQRSSVPMIGGILMIGVS
jgi:hypothetical protein